LIFIRKTIFLPSGIFTFKGGLNKFLPAEGLASTDTLLASTDIYLERQVD
jgi:hypothetical protein